jgi:thimet oligopeptidase
VTAPEPLTLPREDWASWLDARVADLLGELRDTISRLKDGSDRTADQVLTLWNDGDIALRGADSITSVLSEVHPDVHVRERAERLAQDVDRLRTDRDLDGELYAVIDATAVDGLDEQAVRFREHVLRDFRRAGVDRSDETRARLREISERLTVLDQDFARIIRDDVRHIELPKESLAGLPQDWIDAHPANDAGLVSVTTDYPDYIPFRTYARDRDARRALARQFLNRGWPANDDVLHEMLALRDEKARLLGFASWPDYDTDVKMVGTAHAVAELIERIADAAEPAARRDHDALLLRARQDDPEIEHLDTSLVAYCSELIRRESFAVDAQEVRRYFDFDKVRAGLLAVTGRLFGLEYRPVDAAVWHEDVATYDVHRDGERIGRIYLDLHPREGKYKHAAQFDIVGGITDRQLPEGALVCNFPRGLMEHDHVVTLFHEFGHLVHHVIAGRQRYARFSGVATEWDFVEAPSQMLEEWAWDADVLRTFATDADGNPIPADLVDRMRAADDFGKGMFVRTQMFYTAVAFVLHRDRPADHTQTVQELQARYDMIEHLPDTHFQASFGHLAGYTSAYYTYMWSLVIAKDLFSAFDREDLFGAQVATRYRDRILAPGGSKDAADLVVDFLDREFSFDAFAAWLDRAPVPVT